MEVICLESLEQIWTGDLAMPLEIPPSHMRIAQWHRVGTSKVIVLERGDGFPQDGIRRRYFGFDQSCDCKPALLQMRAVE